MERTFPPFVVRIWMQKLKNKSSLSTRALERLLRICLSSGEAKNAVENAIKIGILVPTGKTKKSPVGFCQKLKQAPRSDVYCYECHLAGPLMNCISCSRSFHDDCQRKNPFKPISYMVPATNRYHSPFTESDVEEETNNNTISFEIPCENDESNECIEPGDIKPRTESWLKHEPEDDVQFVSETPASARQRKRLSQSHIKYEEPAITALSGEDTEGSRDLCTACRLLKLSALHHPPNMSNAEISCLLSYSWNSHHTWLRTDVRKFMAKHWDNRDIALMKRVLFKSEILGLADISEKLSATSYNYMMEFLVDLLDLQHNIGVFFGTKCIEFNATKWFLRDIMHDVREILLCPDCFRYSNDPNKTAVWFAQPCLQRHELVFAKHGRYPHWPAKVINVFKTQNSQYTYDVRFFGGSHSRALVSARDILPIDSDAAQIKLKSSRGLTAALKEVKYFEALSRYPASIFGVHADPSQTKEIINAALSHYVEIEEVGVTQRKGKAVKRLMTTSPLMAKRSSKRSLRSRPEQLLEPIAVNMENINSFGSLPSRDPEDLSREIIILNEQLSQCKSELAHLKNDIISVKRKRWCQHCLEEAQFDCCFAASYCTKQCQLRDRRSHRHHSK